MATVELHDLHQRYVQLSDRGRSQWTFYQFLQAICKHLLDRPCPIEFDFQGLFERLRTIGNDLGSTGCRETLDELSRELDRSAKLLLDADTGIPPSLLRRFFDHLRRQDEKVLLAVLKFYIGSGAFTDDIVDKVDILLTRLVEIPRDNGSGTLIRERHEIDRLVQPLLHLRSGSDTPDGEIEGLLDTLADLQRQTLAADTFSGLMRSNVLDTFRTLKRGLGEGLLDPRILPVVLETTVTIKNRFRELWEDEEQRILDDTNRVHELQRHLSAHPEMATAELLDALDRFAALRRKVDRDRKEDTLRREDVLALRQTLTSILDRFDGSQPSVSPPEGGVEPPAEQQMPSVTGDPLLQDHLGKIVFALELTDTDRPPDEIARAREMASLALEPWEVAAALDITQHTGTEGTLDHERSRLYLNAAALRIRIDEEARDIIRLRDRHSGRLPEVLDSATQTLQRASELDRRFRWFVEDALYRGDTGYLDQLYRSRFRLIRAWAGLWLIHNENGGTSPL